MKSAYQWSNSELDVNARPSPYGSGDDSDFLFTSEPAPVVGELRSAVLMARRFPRNEQRALAKIIRACKRPAIARQAVYALRRANRLCLSPSLRLTRTIAQAWGNLHFGVRELSRHSDKLLLEAFCWDLENNVRDARIFTVPAARKTPRTQLDQDPERKPYRTVAAIGARYERACILALIPHHVVETALAACEATLVKYRRGGSVQEEIQHLKDLFASELKISADRLEDLLGHPLSSCSEADLVRLHALFWSIKDGFAQVDDFFPSIRPKTRAQNLSKADRPGPDEGVSAIAPLSAAGSYTSVRELISLEEAIELERLFAHKGLTPSQRQAVLARFGVSAVAELRSSDLPALIAYVAELNIPAVLSEQNASSADKAHR